MAIDPRIALQVQQFQAPDALNALAKAQDVKTQQMSGRMAEREMQAADAEAQSNANLNALFRESGGDLSKMRQNPNLDMNTALRLDELQASQGKTQADKQKAQLDLATKQIEAGIIIVGSARDQGSYDASLQRMEQMGMDVSRFPKEYSPQTVEQLVQQGMSAKDRLQMQRDESRNALEDRRLGIMEQRLSQGGQSSGVDAQDKGWEVKETANGLVRVNKYTGDVAPVTMEGQTLQGKQAASVSAIDKKARQEAMVADKDYQNSVDAAEQAGKLLDKATGSGLGRARDQAYAMVGESTEGAKAAAQLKVIAGKLVAAVPKFSGPQSDADVKLYREMAGQVGDETLPVETRRAALSTVMELQKGESERRKAIFGGGSNAPTPPPAEDNIDDLLEIYQ